MYNLFVSGNGADWEGSPFDIDPRRCVSEYTASEITTKFETLDVAAVSELKKLPCIFAYESGVKKPPRFGVIRTITKRQDVVRIEYEIMSLEPFLTLDDLDKLAFELDIGKWEMNRTHWAVKDVNLAKELKACGVFLPAWARDLSKAVDITTHNFDVALSFPGEVRSTVDKIAFELERRLGPHSYFYDNNYVSQLARPSFDVLLQDIYRNRAKLVVVFLSGDYQSKEWCGIEFRAVREIIKNRDHDKVMFVKMDHGRVDGVFETDGYVDGAKYSTDEIAGFIQERVDVINYQNEAKKNVG